MRFHTFVLKNVVRRRMRSSLTVVGVAVAVGAVVSLIGISSSSERSFVDIYRRQNVAIIVQQKGAKQRLTSVLDEKLGEKIERIPGVEAAVPGLVDVTSLEELDTAVVVNGWRPDSPLMPKLDILPGGRYLKEGDEQRVLLGEKLAVALDKRVGDTVSLFDSGKFTVVGIVHSSNPYESGMLVMLLPDVQKFMGRKGQVSGFAVIIDHPDDQAEIQRICAAIEALGPRLQAQDAMESVTNTTEIRFIRAMSWLTSSIAIIIGAVGVLNTMIMSVAERTKEIGILRAIGWRRLRIVRMVMAESVLLSLAGGIVGALGAIGVTNLLGKSAAVAGLIDTTITPGVLVFGVTSALCIGVVGAAYPAYRGARLLPTEALRHE
jgi:putative ABC transport system permease protein